MALGWPVVTLVLVAPGGLAVLAALAFLALLLSTYIIYLARKKSALDLVVPYSKILF